MIRLKISNLRHLAENFLIFILVDNHRSAFGRFTLQRILMEFFFCNFRLKSLEFAGNCLSLHRVPQSRPCEGWQIMGIYSVTIM